MPFTLAHAAAALPLRRRKLIFSALIIGTFAPDLEYFLRLAPDDGYGHTFKGLFLLTLPLALIAFWLFHSVVKRPIVGLLPTSVEHRLVTHLDEFSFGGPARFGLIVFSILLGAATHLAWDAFTHKNTWAYRNWAVLREVVQLPVFGPTPLFKVFQHGSTLFGMAVLLVWVLLWYRESALSTEILSRGFSAAQRIGIVLGGLILALAGAVFRTVAVRGVSLSDLTGKRAAGLMVVSVIALLWWECVLYGLWWKKFGLHKEQAM